MPYASCCCWVSAEHSGELCVLCPRFLFAVCFIHGISSVQVSVSSSQLLPLPFLEAWFPSPIFSFVVVELLSLTLCNPMDCSTPASSVFHYPPELLKFMSIESMTLSNLLIFCHSLLLLPSIFPSIRVFSNESALHITGQSIGALASASVVPMSIQGWFLSGLTYLISLQSKELSRGFSSTKIQKHQFFGTQPSLWSTSHYPYMTTGKTIVLTIHTFVGKVISLLFNTLPRLVITFLPRKKHLLISWLQSPFTVILEPKKRKSVLFLISNS